MYSSIEKAYESKYGRSLRQMLESELKGCSEYAFML